MVIDAKLPDWPPNRMLIAVQAVPHDPKCYVDRQVDAYCSCTRNARIAKGIEAAVKAAWAENNSLAIATEEAIDAFIQATAL